MNNPFQSPAFSMTALTAAINILPNQFGKLDQINLMPARPVRFRQIAVEERNGVLNLLPTLPVGAPGTVGKRGRRTLRSFIIPHIPHDDVVLPEEVQGIRAFGSETELQTVAGVMAQHLQTMRNKHAITLEHLRMGALKGKILDADGHEVAWVPHLGQCPQPAQDLLRQELARREFMPVITRIVSVTSFSTPCTWKVNTDRGDTEFVLRGDEDIRRIGKDNALLIADVHGIQYLVRDQFALNAASKKILDRFL